MFGWFRKGKQAVEKRQIQQLVTFDDEAVVYGYGAGHTESIRWDELQEVRIQTTDQGPWLDDIFWYLVGQADTCVVPSETEGMPVLLDRLQHLDGFDDKMVIRAMGSTSNQTFVVWKRT